ncbi:MAG TPA: hypothetical protein VLC79_10920, partial [Cellvibrio sp.]|nr:hypothetical protein [Cellvibrio sp.]
MDWVTCVSLLNAATLSIAILGGLIFINTPTYRGVCVLLGLVSVAALANLLEDLQISREFHLISPIFVLGYGPALYIAVKYLIGGSVSNQGQDSYQDAGCYQAMWHFLPMLLVLPFTAHVQAIIAVGTLWRVMYALLTLKLIIDFNRQLTAKRSDASEVSLAWLGWLIGVSTLFSALDLLRLNFQPELGEQLNMLGYAANRFIFFIVLLLLILILSNRRSALETLAGSSIDTQVTSVTSSVTTTSP